MTLRNCKMMIERKVLIIIWIWICMDCALGQFTNVELTQGVVTGLKVFPESSKNPVYAFLGIPYAKAPVDNLRFAPPEPHPGWNVTLLARNFQSACLQLEQNPYEEPTDYFHSGSSQTSEDCLFVNVWAPETGFRSGNLPVLAVITGEDMAFDWINNRPTGLDMSAEGIVVVTIQYRTNIFGWLALPNSGNFGLLDQIEALRWIRENIQKFGGDPAKVTLLGHGTTGAACVMIHLTSKASQDFSSVIIMSGTVFSSYSLQIRNGSEFYLGPTRRIVVNLTCDAADDRFILACLRRKSIKDLIRAYENAYQVGNYTALLGPVLDKRVILEDPRLLIQAGDYKQIPILMGICNQEGAFIKDNWLAFARQGPRVLKEFIENTIIPNILVHSGFGHGLKQIREIIEWKYFDELPSKTAPYYMNALQRLVSETHFEVPFLESIDLIARSRDQVSMNSSASSTVAVNNLYVYSYQQPAPIDMRGRVNYFGGASHGSDLPSLFGPSLLQQIARRRLTQSEDKMGKMLKQLFGDFVKFGNPTPGRIFDAWKTYTTERKFIKVLTTIVDNIVFEDRYNAIEKNLQMLEYQLAPEGGDDGVEKKKPFSPPNYVNDAQDLHYYSELMRTYTFWRRFLARVAKDARQLENAPQNRSPKDDEAQLAEHEGANQKFKHAFFSMLTLTCLLLAILIICVYLLKKNNSTFPRVDRHGVGGYL